MRHFVITLAAGVVALTTGHALAQTNDDFSSLLRSYDTISEDAVMHRAYEAVITDAKWTADQRAQALHFRSFNHQSRFNKLGQLEDLDRVVSEFPNVKRAQDYADQRAYAYRQVWYITGRILGQSRDTLAWSRDSKKLVELWDLGFWDDVEALTAAKRSPVSGKVTALTFGKNDGASTLMERMAAQGRGMESMCKDLHFSPANCSWGDREPSPQKLQGDKLFAAVVAVRERTAPYAPE